MNFVIPKLINEVKRDYYIFNSGDLKRKDFNVEFKSSFDGSKKILPIKTIDNIFVFSKLNLNSDLINYFGENNINVHFYNYYSNYRSSITGIGMQHSGNTHLNQAKHCLNFDKKLYLAKEFVKSAFWGMNKVLNSYDKGIDIKRLKNGFSKIDKCVHINELMGVEGSFRKFYYKNLGGIIKNFKFEKRTKRPPEDEINALISFGNSLCYNYCLNSIKQTYLNSTISFLHECGERRHSLCLDISEIFKPIIIDRVILKLVNNNRIKKNMFVKEKNFCYINKAGKKLFISEIEDKLNTTFYYRKLNKNISYKRLILIECYKLCKHILDIEKYKALKINW